MDSSHLSFKLFADAPPEADLKGFVPLFHSWIQTHAIPDHLLVDVADYAHVHNGPGIVLIAREANYSLDQRGGRFGLTYQRKQPLPGDLPQRIKSAYDATQAAARLLAGKLKFHSDEIEFRVCDRLQAPNDDQTLEQLRAPLRACFPGASIERHAGPDELFGVIIRPA